MTSFAVSSNYPKMHRGKGDLKTSRRIRRGSSAFGVPIVQADRSFGRLECHHADVTGGLEKGKDIGRQTCQNENFDWKQHWKDSHRSAQTVRENEYRID